MHPCWIIAIKYDNASFEVWSFKKAETPKMLWNTHQPGIINDIALSPDGSIVATAHHDQKISLWNAKNGDLLTTIDTGEENFRLAFSPNGKTLAIVSSDTGGTTMFHDAKLFYAEK